MARLHLAIAAVLLALAAAAPAAHAVAPFNDSFETALDPAAGRKPNGATSVGPTTEATKQPGEPDHAGDPGGRSVWFRYTPPASGPVSVDTCSSTTAFDTVVAVYTGSAVGALSPVASNDDSAGCGTGVQSRVTFAATAGTTYHVAVDGKGGASGELATNFLANDDLAQALDLLGAPLDLFSFGDITSASAETGEPLHAGVAGGRSIWFRLNSPVTRSVTLSTCQGAPVDTLLAVYTGAGVANLTAVASNDDGLGCLNGGARVVFTAVAGTEYSIALDAKTVGLFNLHYVLSDAFADAIDVGDPVDGRVLATVALVDGTKEAGEPDHAGDPGGRSVWFRFTVPVARTVRLSTCDLSAAGLNTLLAVYTGASVGALTLVAASDDAPGCGALSELSFPASPGETYFVALDDRSVQPGARLVRLTAGPAVGPGQPPLAPPFQVLPQPQPQLPPSGPDRDLDRILDPADNCPDTANTGQADADRDGVGDACDSSDASVGPRLAETVVATVISGDVFVRYPKGYKPRAATSPAAPAPQQGFVALKGASILPVGSIVDADNGRLAILAVATAARATAGAKPTKRQTAEFYEGTFQIKQARATRPVTDILLRSPGFAKGCGTTSTRAAGAAASKKDKERAKRKVVAQLWGDGKGTFRTRGRESAASVRGTVWLTQERCDGTLTRVTRGKVSVRDLNTKRTVIVRAGESYLARAVRASVKTQGRRP